MKWSLTLGRISGIRIVMHWTFLLLLAWIVITELGKGSDTNTILLTVAYVLCIFVCVILHEFGHALTARKFGIKTPKVTLLPIGGVASLERMPRKPKQELLVAVAGPAVNVVIAAILLLVGSFSFQGLFELENIKTLQTISTDNFLYALCLINLFLVAFNAIPAFPMDGGRVLRAILSFKMERSKATNVAATLGQIVGVGFILLGLFGNIILIFIGLFVTIGARSENTLVQQQEVLRGHKIKEAMMTRFTTLNKDDSLQKAVDKLLEGSENHFSVVDDGKAVGILTKDRLVKALHDHQDRDLEISRFAITDFQTFNTEDPLSDAFMNLQRDKGKQRLFPVLQDGRLEGVLDMENLQEFVQVKSE